MYPNIDLGMIKLNTFPIVLILAIFSCVLLYMYSIKYDLFYFYQIKWSSVYCMVGAGVIGKVVYVFCGILSGIAGILICSRITSGNGTVAEGYEMNAISAAVIGGVSMTGGSGNVLGMVVGAMILTIIQNSFDIMGVNSFYQNIIKGIIILLAVFLDLRGKKKKN